jgi:hypothetical protein
MVFDAIFLGVDALALVQQNNVTVHSLTDAAAPPCCSWTTRPAATRRPLADGLIRRLGRRHGASQVYNVMCTPVGDTGGWLVVYGLAALRAELLSPPRHEVKLGTRIAGLTFSDASTRLLTMCISGAVEVRDVEVRDAWAEG